MNAAFGTLVSADLKKPVQICGHLRCAASAFISGQLRRLPQPSERWSAQI
jgi:hypothetical protein